MSRANSIDTMGTMESGGDFAVELLNDIETGFAPLPPEALPETLPALGRSLMRVAPNWNIQEAFNGETSSVLTDSSNFDLIFMDQYVVSVDKELLGTEAVCALQAKGFANLICGLSANNMAEAFAKSGADTFLLKSFSCDQQLKLLGKTCSTVGTVSF